ncbi:MAG: hypothetical protein M1825_001013 [Sarcosagium campestre]|nr:MAG: hypothetical protein M1825_001013 [Sarcosagium campestre]
MDETFTLLPIQMDPSSKAISIPPSTSSSTPQVTENLKNVNALHRLLLSLETPVPPPPVPVNPKRSAQITKMREAGNASLRKGAAAEAVRMYSMGIRMAVERPPWEPAGLVRDELAGLYANRAQAHMSTQAWADAAVDAESSVECKRVGNAKAWWRRGKCLLEMGRADEAANWVSKALEFEGKDADLLGLMADAEATLKRRNGGLVS